MPMPPLLGAIGGLSGTWKSVLARSLASMIEPPPGAVIVRSDVVRKHLFDVSEIAALPGEAYQPDVSRQTDEVLSNTGQRVLAQGCSVILDASFMEETQRTALLDLARERSMRFVGLFLTANLATRLARIAHREHDASDATPDVALKQETVVIGDMDWHVVDASGTQENALRRSAACVAEANGRIGQWGDTLPPGLM